VIDMEKKEKIKKEKAPKTPKKSKMPEGYKPSNSINQLLVTGLQLVS